MWYEVIKKNHIIVQSLHRKRDSIVGIEFA